MKQFKCALFVLLCLTVSWAYAKVRSSETDIRKYSPPPPPADTLRGLIGYYYQDKNGDNHFTTLVQSSVIDTSFCYNWEGNGPGYGITNDYFSVKWVGMLRVPVSGTYTFNSNADDGLKFIIKDFANRRADPGTVVMNNNGACCADFSGTATLEAGRLYPIEIEFFENTGGANIMYFMWSTTGLPKQQVWSEYFYAMQPPEAARPRIEPAGGLFEESVDVVLSTATPGGIIHYTLDGTIPTANSPVYDPLNPIKLTTTTTVKAGTWKADMFVSEVSTATITVVPPPVSNPVFVPSAGSYNGPVDVDLSVNEPGASIYYTIDGSTPTTSSLLYTGTLHVDSTIRIKAFSVKEGFSPSKVVAGTYTILPPAAVTPVFSVPAGNYSGEQTVAITCATPGAVIRFALNDEVLNSNSPVYEGPVKISTTTTLKAYASADGLYDSKANIATYVIGNDDAVSAPKFSLPPGTYMGIRQIGLFSDTKGAIIHYTTDGTVPDENSSEYFALIPVKDSTTINAIAYKPGMRPSEVSTGIYIISAEARDTSLFSTNLPVPKLSVTPNPASDMVRISWTNVVTTKEGFRVVITDSKGAVVNTTLVQGGYTYYQFNTSTLAEGVYFVKVQSGNSIAKGKLIVAR